MLTDEQLVQSYLDGNKKAFEELFERHRSKVFNFVLRMLGNRAAAEEAFQEVFLRVHNKLGHYKPQERFSAWLFTIAHNICLDELRKRKRERWLVFGETMQEQISGMNPENDAFRNQIRERIMQKLEALDSNQKQIFLLRVHGNLLFREIAEVLRMPLNTVLVRYHQAVQTLKQSLKEANV